MKFEEKKVAKLGFRRREERSRDTQRTELELIHLWQFDEPGGKGLN